MRNAAFPDCLHAPGPASPTASASSRSLATAFAEISQCRGDAVAVRCGEDQISYENLAARAQAIAATLRSHGAAKGALVAIYAARGIDMIAAMLGVCYAGAAYLPLDLTFPEARVRDTLADARPVVVLTDTADRAQFLRDSTPVLLLGDIRDITNVTAPEQEVGPDDLAYVIYTSGSTGRPKGVMVSQHNVLRLLSETQQWFEFTESDVWTMFHSLAFDFSVWEIWGALLTGATLLIVSYETSRRPEEFYALLSRERVTVLNQTPTAFGLLCQAVEQHSRPLALRYVIFGGEALSFRSLRSWVERFGDERPQLINMYGITETTVHVTYRRVRTSDIALENESLIGVPIPDLTIYLLDEDKRPVRDGAPGEMYIRGDGVATGYLGRPELTSERFLRNFLDAAGGRLYRSGDLARRRQDGELVYLGRADRQVKINGFRVEPGEIEAALMDVSTVQQACVVPVKAAEGALLLVAYFVASRTIDQAALAASLGARLPAHMRPTCYVQLSSMPVTANGKTDREALPVPPLLNSSSDRGAGQQALPQVIAELWANILQRPDIDINDNFFDAGGTSLQLLALRTALQQKLDRSIPVLWLFEHTTPALLARKLAPTEMTPLAHRTRSSAERQRQSFARARAARSSQA